MSQEENVRKASKQFYDALNGMIQGDAGKLAKVWSHDASVTAMHPIGSWQTGWQAVQESFEKVAEISNSGEVKIENQVIQVVGDLAYEMGVERGKADFSGKNVVIDHRVTNIYKLEGGEWKIVHHHCDLSPAMVEAVKAIAVTA